MKALLIPLAACAALAGCAGYVETPYGYGYGNPGYTSAYPGYGYGGGVYTEVPVYRGEGRRSFDRDRDGMANRRDGDRDGDGVPNRFDDHPNNPRRN